MHVSIVAHEQAGGNIKRNFSPKIHNSQVDSSLDTPGILIDVVQGMNCY